MCSPEWSNNYIRNQIAIWPSIEKTMFVCHSQNPCVSTSLSHTVLSQTQPPMQSTGSSSLWQWSPKNLGYCTNSHLGSCYLLTRLSVEFPRAHTVSSPQPRLHIFNLYGLLIVKPMHLLWFLLSAGSLSGCRGGWGSVSLAFFFPSRSVFSGRGNGSVSVLGIHVCVHTYVLALGCLRSCLKHVFTRYGLFTMANVYMDQRSSALALG